MAKRKTKIDKTKLTQAEMDSIRKFDEYNNLKAIELKNTDLQRRLLDVQYQLDAVNLANKKSLFQKALKDRMEVHKEKMKLMADSRKIEGKWSFDPDSGAIIMEDI